LKDSIRFFLAKIDEADETFLNGIKIGGTGRLPDNARGYEGDYDKNRWYVLPWNHPAVKWDNENVIAIRVFDRKNEGGLWGAVPTVGMLDIIDYLRVKTDAPYDFKEQKFIRKEVQVVNHFHREVAGELIMKLMLGKEKFVTQKQKLVIKPHSLATHSFRFPNHENAKIVFSFREARSRKQAVATQHTPYILTPKERPLPVITNPAVYGARPGSPFLWTVVATGKRPMRFDAKGLPEGIKIDKNTGQITGKVEKAGNYEVILSAMNALGQSEKKVVVKIGSRISLTPPMGWNSWNCWGLSVSDEKVKSSADALITSGLVNHGWMYMNIDDGWQKGRDSVNGHILPNEKFPDMKGLSDYVHSLGLKMGIYSSPGPTTCGGYTGSWQHEALDVKTYEKWGIDYLKYDWCSYTDIVGGSPEQWDIPTLQKPYLLLDSILQNTERDIVNSVCQYGLGEVWKWGYDVGGHLWRTTDDIVDTWESLSNIGFIQDKAAPYSRPGGWNDPDMLTVGWVGWGDKLHQTRLTYSEQYTQVSLWAMLSAPLLIGCDISKIDDFTYNLLANSEVIAIDQDPLGKAAMPVIKEKDYQIWVKQLADGSKVIGLFNLNENERPITVNLNALGFTGTLKLRDVWRQKHIGRYDGSGSFTTKAYGHGAVLIKVMNSEQ
jgi:hypothetical protein